LLTFEVNFISPFSKKVTLFTGGTELSNKQVNVTLVPSTPVVFPIMRLLVGTKKNLKKIKIQSS